MAEPTLTDVMAALHRIDQQNQQQTSLLTALTVGVQLMSTQVDTEVAAEQALAVKVDALLAAFNDAKTVNGTLSQQIAALTAQIEQLRADGVITTVDADKLAAATAEMAAKSAAIDVALTPPATP